jgi:hypothetical protein
MGIRPKLDVIQNMKPIKSGERREKENFYGSNREFAREEGSYSANGKKETVIFPGKGGRVSTVKKRP